MSYHISYVFDISVTHRRVPRTCIECDIHINEAASEAQSPFCLASLIKSAAAITEEHYYYYYMAIDQPRPGSLSGEGGGS